MICSVRDCRGRATRCRFDKWYCDDCYEYLFLRLPDPPSWRTRLREWWSS